jgi:dTDP-4-amino-4,6-dideoxygalactose transaminase
MRIQHREPRQVPFVDLAAQHATIEHEITQALGDVLRRGDFILGKDVAALEEEFAAYCGVNHAIGVDSLELLLRAYHIGPGDEVITQANTFIATALAISSVGATPVLVDCEPQGYMLDLAQLEAAITPRTRAILPVHLYGQIGDMDAILAIAERHGLIVIEDACQAHGARYKGRRAGSLGHAAAFSFYPAKNLGALGDGGMAVTNDAKVAQTLRLLRNYGSTQKYHHEVCGFNRRLDTLHAAVLRVKLNRLDDWNAARRTLAAEYTRLLQPTGVICPPELPQTEPVYHLYVIRTPERDRLQAHLRDQGISTVIHYPIPIHLQPAYKHLGLSAGSFPVAEQLANEILSLPMYAELPRPSVAYVADAVGSFMQLHTAASLMPALMPA